MSTLHTANIFETFGTERIQIPRRNWLSSSKSSLDTLRVAEILLIQPMVLNISRILLDKINMGREERYQRFEEFFMIQEGPRSRCTLFFCASSRTLLNISRILLEKINVGREERYFSDSQSFSWSRKDFGDDIHYFICYFKNTAEYFKNPAG
ncbi:hypothetical protein JTB14_023349 [Gonioctena quinquepunctata]|nr:hypothetical protein JTB14_023349 [Gonioctena quinquepunctata]